MKIGVYFYHLKIFRVFNLSFDDCYGSSFATNVCCNTTMEPFEFDLNNGRVGMEIQIDCERFSVLGHQK